MNNVTLPNFFDQFSTIAMKEIYSQIHSDNLKFVVQISSPRSVLVLYHKNGGSDLKTFLKAYPETCVGPYSRSSHRRFASASLFRKYTSSISSVQKTDKVNWITASVLVSCPKVVLCFSVVSWLPAVTVFTPFIQGETKTR